VSGVENVILSLIGFLLPGWAERKKRKRETLLALKTIVKKLIARARAWQKFGNPSVGDIGDLDREFYELETNEGVWDFKKSDLWRRDFMNCGRDRLLSARKEGRLKSELDSYLKDLEKLEREINRGL
jgi:hypothetical protein